MPMTIGEEVSTGRVGIYHKDDPIHQTVELSVDVDFEIGTLFHLHIQANTFSVTVGPFPKEGLTEMAKILEMARQEIDYKS